MSFSRANVAESDLEVGRQEGICSLSKCPRDLASGRTQRPLSGTLSGNWGGTA